MAKTLAPYAACAATSVGRLYPVRPCSYRSAFQRDRDRIIHADAFRRLQAKTQVFVYHEGDHYRTRLTHTIEVAQIARTLARALKIEEDLSEAIALAHDLGHPPFGHAGEHSLSACMADWGGFDHNGQSIRVVSWLERPYGAHNGLNLTWDCLEGMAKHNGPFEERNGVSFALAQCDADFDLALKAWPSLEAQVAALADEITYYAHDLVDGVRAGLFAVKDVAQISALRGFVEDIRRAHPHLDAARLVQGLSRRLITLMVDDALAHTQNNLSRHNIASVDAVRSHGKALAGFSKDTQRVIKDLRNFLFARMYRHPSLTQVMEEAQQVLRALFVHYMRNPGDLPQTWQGLAHKNERATGGHGHAAFQDDKHSERARRVCDYLAGMTDRYAMSCYQALIPNAPELTHLRLP